jgi:trans-aconitate 2-methyltransferase
MTEWNAPAYARIAGLQETMAAEVLELLDLKGTERVLDLGCGNGKVTARIAARVPRGEVVGVDASARMIALASSQFPPATIPNLHFETHDIRKLPFRAEFDVVVSFNALHWITDQAVALSSMRTAMKPDGLAQLRLVPAGKRKSLENVIEETRLSSRWVQYFDGFHDPYLHLTPEEYGALAEENGLRVGWLHAADKAWDFKSRSAFVEFGSVTFVEWTRFIPEGERISFINDVLDRYQVIAADQPGQENVFRFYQLDVTLSAGLSAR